MGLIWEDDIFEIDLVSYQLRKLLQLEGPSLRSRDKSDGIP